jgi:hypothetical protein
MTSTIKVNTIQNTCGADIIKESGNTITIGASGDTVTLGSGASQSGFGRSGSVNWQTSIKTANFTAASGEGYFCDTSSGAFTLTLPSSPSVGDIVALKDYGSSFGTNNLTIGRGGSNLNGNASDNVRDTNDESLTMVYADSTKGWLSVEEGTGFLGANFIEATGGTITTVCTDFKVHTFTGPGTFCVSKIATCAANNQVSHIVVAGGASGALHYGGGGGAGGFRENKSPVTPYTASPLDGQPSAPNRVTVTATSFPITVGGGGAASPNSCEPAKGTPGSNSIFSTITSAGGGGGGVGANCGQRSGISGGSGGGSGSGGPTATYSDQGAGNTPPTTPSQGNPGGTSSRNPSTHTHGGGGGGATANGVNGGANGVVAGCGGAGATTSINGTPTAFAGGGGGTSNTGGGGLRPNGGAGGGGRGAGPGGNTGEAGTANTGGGGGAGQGNGTGAGAGGSGIVIIRYKFQ